MVYVSFIILGLLQGMTEFLPISSSGHLFLVGKIFDIEETLFVSIVLHVATLLSIVFVMRKEILEIVKHPFSKQMKNLIVSTIVTFIIVLIVFSFTDQTQFENFVPFCFMVSACFLFLTDLSAKNKRGVRIRKKHSLIMGFAQGVAIFPGISRSGATICAGIMSGAEKEECAKHSFLMSLPIVAASLIMEVFEISTIRMNTPICPLLISFFIAFVCGILSLRFMIKLTCKIKFRYFAYYLAVLSVVSFFV